MDRGDLQLQQMAETRRVGRLDWRTAQIVDRAIEMLAKMTLHHDVQAFMTENLVPLNVQLRVLAGHAVSRHRGGEND